METLFSFETLNSLILVPGPCTIYNFTDDCTIISNTYGGQERSIQGFGGGILKERNHLEDPGVDENTILRWVFRK